MRARRWLGLLFLAVRKDPRVLLTRPIAAIFLLVFLVVLLTVANYISPVGGVIVLAGCCLYIGNHMDGNNGGIDKEVKWYLGIFLFVSLAAIGNGFWDWWEPFSLDTFPGDDY